MGTVGYMSPEQVRGRPVDKRSDIFSLGSILYEMLTGERAFRGDSAAETMAAIAQKDPPELAEPTGRFPAVVERILRHCLEKRPEDRFDTAHDLAFAIETAMGVSSGPRVEAAPRERRRPMLGWILGAVAVAAALGAGLLLGSRFRAPSNPQFRRITYHRGYVESARFSPDGQTVIFGSTRRDEPLRIYSTRLDSVESRVLDLPPRGHGARDLPHGRDGAPPALHAPRILDPLGNARPRRARRRRAAGDPRARHGRRHLSRRQGPRGRPRSRQAAAAGVPARQGRLRDRRLGQPPAHLSRRDARRFSRAPRLRQRRRIRRDGVAGRAGHAADQRMAGRAGPGVVEGRQGDLVHGRKRERRPTVPGTSSGRSLPAASRGWFTGRRWISG